MEIEDQVQLADGAKVVVQDLDEQVDGLQGRQLAVGGVDAGCESQARVPPGHELVGPPVEDVGGRAGVPAGRRAKDVHLGRPLLRVGQGHIKLGEAGLRNGGQGGERRGGG